MGKTVVAVGYRKPMLPSLSILWALVPLVTLGWGTGFSFAYAAFRLRDGVLGWSAAGYFLWVSSPSRSSAASDNDGSGWQGTLGTFLILALIALGSAHAFGIRKHLVDPTTPRRRRKIVSVQEQALAEARAEMQRRDEARRILIADPELARQLCIGRPDLPRQYLDGGWSTPTTLRLGCWHDSRASARSWRITSSAIATASGAIATSLICRSLSR